MSNEEGSPKERNAFDERIGGCEFSYETAETSNGLGVAIVRFRGLVYDAEWGSDFEKKITRICEKCNWDLCPIAVSDDTLTIVVSFGPFGSRKCLGNLRRLLQMMKLDTKDAVKSQNFYGNEPGNIDCEDDFDSE